MNEVSIKDVYDVLLTIKQDLGGLRATVKSTAETLSAHIEDDKQLATSMVKMQLHNAKSAGAAKVWAMVAGAFGVLLGAAADYFTFRGH
jgi:hypothetical protein